MEDDIDNLQPIPGRVEFFFGSVHWYATMVTPPRYGDIISFEDGYYTVKDIVWVCDGKNGRTLHPKANVYVARTDRPARA